jgi:hypothetical protein
MWTGSGRRAPKCWGLALLVAVSGIGCAPSPEQEVGDGADRSIEAYLIVLGAYSEKIERGEFAWNGVGPATPRSTRIMLMMERGIPGLPTASGDSFTTLDSLGYSLVPPGAKFPCPGEVWISLGPAVRDSVERYSIDAEASFRWETDRGDIFYSRFEIDCGEESCRLASEQFLSQEEVGLSPQDCAERPGR